MKLVYIAGPYRAASKVWIEQNIHAARRTAIRLIAAVNARVKPGVSAGWFPVTPHMNTALFDFASELDDVGDQYYLDGTMQQMLGCEAVILISADAIQKSSGTALEVREANRKGIPVFVDVESFIEWLEDPEFRRRVNHLTRQTQLMGGGGREVVTFSYK